ncbi:hypothetical protein V8E36_002176 [Tilletia maclaganii]
MSAAAKTLLDAELSQERAADLFVRSSFIILDSSSHSTSSTTTTTFTIDASPYYSANSPSSSSSSRSSSSTSTALQGFKLIPDGFHLLTLASETEPVPIHGVIRFTHGHQVFVRTVSKESSTLTATDAPSASSSSTRVQRSTIPAPSQPQTVTSPDHLRALDPQLVPYPHTTTSVWQRATAHLSDTKTGPSTVARVCGIDSWTGDAHIDSFSELVEEQETQGPTAGGVSSRMAQAEQALADQLRNSGKFDGSPEHAHAMLNFTSFDLKRSWKPGTFGQDLTRWSVDKSWLLADTVQKAGNGRLEDLLAEFELAFVLLHRLHSPAGLKKWTVLLALFCRSAHACSGAPAFFDVHPADPSSTLASSTASQSASESTVLQEIDATLAPDTHVRFLKTLLAQFQLVAVHASITSSSASEFFTSLHPSLETEVLRELGILRRNISAGLTARAKREQLKARHTGSRQQDSSKQAPTQAQQGAGAGKGNAQQLLSAWRALSHFGQSAFGWTLDEELDEEAEIREDDEAEEGDDAPVIVDLGDDEYDAYE